MTDYKTNINNFSRRIILFYLGIFFTFAIIGKQLWILQIESGEYYKELADNNRFKVQIIPPPRGLVYDKNEDLLIDNRPRYDMIATLEEIINPEKEAEILSEILNIPYKIILKKLTVRDKSLPRYAPSIVATDLSEICLTKAYENLYKLSGIDIEIKPVRSYIYDKLASHILGYTGRISKKELKQLKDTNYNRNDEIGKKGVEHAFESFIRGIPGGRQVQVNSFGQLDAIFGEKKPIKGNDIYLTIDLKIQKTVEKAIEGKKGAIIVMNPNTGAILAMTSQPSFNPNDFSTGSSSKIRKYLIDKSFPLLNKAISSQFAPGSIFKPIVALAGLKKKIITHETSVFCNGKFKLGNSIFKCWRKWGHGETDLIKSLEQSCNVFYYSMGKEMGWEAIYNMCKKFKFGEKTGIKLNGEKSGLVPSESWKKKRFKNRADQKWHLGDTINFSIGQGALLTTPIQLVCMVSAIATKGLLPSPYYVEKILNKNKEIIYTPEKNITNLNIPLEDIKKVRHGMFNVVNARYGTGRKARVKGIKSAGKTGTAQIKSKGVDRKNTWFICFSPFDNPEIAMVILIEDGESGGSSAAPIAKQIIASYFNIVLDKKDKNQEKEKIITTIDTHEVIELENLEITPQNRTIPIEKKVENISEKKNLPKKPPIKETIKNENH